MPPPRPHALTYPPLKAIEWWDAQHALGYTHIAPIGGSDDHHGGQQAVGGGWSPYSPVGCPTTLVLAANLSNSAVGEALRLGRTAVKVFSALDPVRGRARAPHT